MELALGTVQFGLPYGVAGRALAVPEDEVRQILHRAAALGIRLLDTAAAYGDIEARLLGLTGKRAFSVVSKLPAIPQDLTAHDAPDWVDAALQRTRERLGSSLVALMFHRAEDLMGDLGVQLWERCVAWARGFGCKLGVSCYSPLSLELVRERFPVEIAQLPGNALDQRLRAAPAPGFPSVEIHVRSAFLQGLLLLPEAEASRRVPRAAAALRRWHDWLRQEGLDALPAALSLVKSLPGVTHCVVGVDNLAQLESIAAAWHSVPARHVGELAVSDLDVIDPRRWPART